MVTGGWTSEVCKRTDEFIGGCVHVFLTRRVGVRKACGGEVGYRAWVARCSMSMRGCVCVCGEVGRHGLEMGGAHVVRAI